MTEGKGKSAVERHTIAEAVEATLSGICSSTPTTRGITSHSPGSLEMMSIIVRVAERSGMLVSEPPGRTEIMCTHAS